MPGKTEVNLAHVQKLTDDLIDDYNLYWRDHHRDINQYVFPRRGRFLDYDRKEEGGKKRYNDIINTEAVIANNKLAAGLQGGLVSKQKNWFKLKLSDRMYKDEEDVKEWLELVQDIMYDAFNSGTFYTAEFEGFCELGAYCTSCLYMEEDYEDVAWFKALTIGQYFIGVNRKGRVDTIARVMWVRSDELVDEYGKENCSKAVVDDYEKKSGKKETFQVVHCVFPNPDYKEGNLIAKYKRYRSVTFEFKSRENRGNRDKNGQVLRDSGYNRFPYIVSRWATTGGEEWGRGPGTDALADIKGLQKIEERGYKSLDRWLRPPIVAHHSLSEKGLSLYPDAISYYSGDQVRGGMAQPIYTTRPEFQQLELRVQRAVDIIKRHFYNDLFTTFIDNVDQTKTAFEVTKIEGEKLQQIGSVVTRFDEEHIEAVIDNMYDFLDRNNVIPPPPDILPDGFRIEVEHVSPLASAQKLQQTKGIEAYRDFIFTIAQADPKAVYKMDTFAMIDQYHDLVGAPIKVNRDDEEANRLYQEFVQAQQQAQQQAMLPQQAKAAKDLSEAKTGTDSVLDTMLEGLQ